MAAPVTSWSSNRVRECFNPFVDPFRRVYTHTYMYMWVIAPQPFPDLGYCRCNRRDCCGLPIIGPDRSSRSLSPFSSSSRLVRACCFENRPPRTFLLLLILPLLHSPLLSPLPSSSFRESSIFLRARIKSGRQLQTRTRRRQLQRILRTRSAD